MKREDDRVSYADSADTTVHPICEQATGKGLLPAIEFRDQAQRLAQLRPGQEDHETGSTQAVEAKFVTPLDPVIVTAEGGRLPAVPIEEAVRLNRLKDRKDGRDERSPPRGAVREGMDGTAHGARLQSPVGRDEQNAKEGVSLNESVPQSRTNPLFPPVSVSCNA
nr:hypothetical protein CFP56_09980 [Quercus suber]